jgi:cytochrome P450
VIHDIWKSTGSSGRTYAQRRLLDLQRNDQLTKRLPRVTEDARKAFQALSDAPSNVINPSKICYRVVVQQGARIVGSDTIADDPTLMEPLLKYMPILQFTSSLHLLAFPWLSYCSASYWKRKYGRWGVTNIVKPIVDKRMAPGAAPVDDALQTLINAGDSKDYITNFMISMLFIAGANSGVISGSMLNIVAHHPDWQEKIYQEIKTSASKYAKNQNASLVDQLDSLPLEGWEKMSASIDLCYTEAIRMWVAFPMGRFNDTDKAIPIPGTEEVIPAGSFACYNTGDVHYSEKLYPNPMKWEPERWQEGRDEFKQEAYGCELTPTPLLNRQHQLTFFLHSHGLGRRPSPLHRHALG